MSAFALVGARIFDDGGIREGGAIVVENGRITALDLIADPGRVAAMDVEILS